MVAQRALLLNPVGEVGPLDLGLAPRLPDLNGKVLGLIDNAKPNADVLMAKVEQLLTERYRFSRIFRTRKRHGLFFPTFGSPIPVLTKPITLVDGSYARSVKDFKRT